MKRFLEDLCMPVHWFDVGNFLPQGPNFPADRGNARHKDSQKTYKQQGQLPVLLIGMPPGG